MYAYLVHTSNFLSNFITEKMMQYVCDVCVGYQFSKQSIIFMLHDVVSFQYKYRHRKIQSRLVYKIIIYWYTKVEARHMIYCSVEINEIYRESMFRFWWLTKTLLNHDHEFESFTLYFNPTLSEHGLNFGNRKSLKVVHFRKILHWYKLNFILSI